MIGKETLRIGANELALGMASNDYAEDGYIGRSSYNINPFKTRGSLAYTDVGTDKSDAALGNLIGSCADTNTSPNARVFISDTGHIVSANDTGTLTSRGQDTTNTYLSLNSDIVEYNGYIYTTSTTDVMWVQPSSWTLDHDWWTNTQGETGLGSSTFHPMVVYQGSLWIGDGARLHSYNPTDGSTYGALALGSDERITALHIDPGSGMMMIGVVSALDNDGKYNPRSYIYLHDGASAYPRRKIPVEAQVTGFCNVAGRTFVGYGKNIGLWTGSGISFVREVYNATYDRKYLPGKHQMAAWENVFLYNDGVDVIAFGETQRGSSGFYPLFRNGTANAGRMLAYIGNDRIMVSSGTNSKTYYFDMNATQGDFNLYSRWFVMDRRVNITGVTVFTNDFDDSPSLGSVHIIDERGNQITPQSPAIKNYSNTTTLRSTRIPFSVNTQAFQVYITSGGSSTLQVRSIVVDYNVLE